MGRKMTKEITELYEDPKQLQHDVALLKDWLLKQPHIHGRTDEEFLICFLRGCKYSLERAKEKLDVYYTMRTAAPEFFTRRDTLDPIMQECYQLGLVIPLGRDDKGRIVVMARAGTYDPNKIPLHLGVKSHIMSADVMLQEYADTLNHGVVLIVDMKNVLLSHIVHYTPAACKKIFMVYQNGFPVRPKAIHVLNVPPVLDSFLAITTAVLKEKIRRRIIFHKHLESLYETVPKNILPKEYGGTGAPIQEITENWRKNMVANRSFLLEDEQHRVDESKRPGKPKTHEDLFGFEGSFRQLSVD